MKSYYPSPDDHESIRWLLVTDKLPHFLFGFSMYENCTESSDVSLRKLLKNINRNTCMELCNISL